MSSPMYEMPEHMKFPVTVNGEGPAEGSDIDRYVCWACLGEEWPCEGSKNVRNN